MALNSSKTFIAVAARILVLFKDFADSLTATASALEAADAKGAGAACNIVGAHDDNPVYVSAELIK